MIAYYGKYNEFNGQRFWKQINSGRCIQALDILDYSIRCIFKKKSFWESST